MSSLTLWTGYTLLRTIDRITFYQYESYYKSSLHDLINNESEISLSLIKQVIIVNILWNENSLSQHHSP